MIPWTYTRINNLGYKYKSYPSLPLICPVSCLAAIFQAGTRILDMEHCWNCRKNVSGWQVINCCSGPVWHIILLQGQTRNLWISHGGFMRQQNQQVWNKQLPETSSEANSAEGSSNITLWLQPATRSRVHLCLKIATKAEITNNKDLFSTAATWTIKLTQKKNSLPHLVRLMESLHHLLLVIRGKNWHEEQSKIRTLCLKKNLEANILPSTIRQEEGISDFRVGWASSAARG